LFFFSSFCFCLFPCEYQQLVSGWFETVFLPSAHYEDEELKYGDT